MMIVMKATATEDDVQSVIERIESVGAHAHPSRGEEVTVIGAIGDREHIARLELEGSPGVDRVVPILKPYKLASAQIRHEKPSVLEIGGRSIGGEPFGLYAGTSTRQASAQLGAPVPAQDANTDGGRPRRPPPPGARGCARRAPKSRARAPTPSRGSASRACACS